MAKIQGKGARSPALLKLSTLVISVWLLWPIKLILLWETHVKNVCSHSCALHELFQSYLWRHGAGCTTAAGGSRVQS